MVTRCHSKWVLYGLPLSTSTSLRLPTCPSHSLISLLSASAATRLPFNDSFIDNTVQSAGIAWAETMLNMTFAFSITPQDGKSYIVPIPQSLSKTGITHYFTDVAVLSPSCSFPKSNITGVVNTADSTKPISPLTPLPIAYSNGLTITITPSATFG
jgi:hypothetical protein